MLNAHRRERASSAVVVSDVNEHSQKQLNSGLYRNTGRTLCRQTGELVDNTVTWKKATSLVTVIGTSPSHIIMDETVPLSL